MDCDKNYCDLTNCKPAGKFSCVKPVWNLKCILLTLFLAAAYWFLPRKNVIVLGIILYVTYLALAWYDYWYDCRRNMGPTYLSLFYAPFKPQQSDQIREYDNWHPSIKRTVRIVDLIVLIVVLTIITVWIRIKT